MSPSIQHRKRPYQKTVVHNMSGKKNTLLSETAQDERNPPTPITFQLILHRFLYNILNFRPVFPVPYQHNIHYRQSKQITQNSTTHENEKATLSRFICTICLFIFLLYYCHFCCIMNWEIVVILLI